MTEDNLHKKSLQQKNMELEQTKVQLQQTKVHLEKANSIIAWMETSKFWKLRSKWIKIKKSLSKKSLFELDREEPESFQIESFPVINQPRLIPSSPTVLIVGETSIPQCLRYRIEQKIEQLQHINYTVSYINWHNYSNIRHQLHFCHIVIFYRVPAYPEIIKIIKYARALRKIVFFDIDDLVFDVDSYIPIIESIKKKISSQETDNLIEGAKLYRHAMSLCDYAIASTKTLAKKMEQVVTTKKSFVHPNGIDKVISSYLQSIPSKLARDYISVFYGSGTKTHDADFLIVSSTLASILAKYKNVRLTIVGYLEIPDVLLPFTAQIDQVKYLDIEPYFEFLSQADISISPLRSGIFEDSKSEIKWLEAALLKVPSIVSATQTYVEILEDGVDGFIANCAQEWFSKLDALIGNGKLRSNIAKNAYLKAYEKYSVPLLANNIQQIFQFAIEESIFQGVVKTVQGCKRKSLLFVNVLYPPQSLGGATVVVKNIVDSLEMGHYGDYDISVFTCDISSSSPYQLSEYVYGGVNVTAISVPIVKDIDWNYQDSTVHNIFKQYLDFNCPDLIHFHCTQILTASTVVAAVELNIPYIVTLHDAWWLGDHQFLVDKHGIECNPQLNDPLIAARYSDDINRSIHRRIYLAKCLNQAKILLAVSEFQADLYRKNGFKVKVNRNGISPHFSILPRTKSISAKVRLGFTGGICIHKGFYLLKEAIILANLKNMELQVIVVDLAPTSIRSENWNSTLVTFIPMLPPDKMPEFFSSIDVLIAPSIWTESFGLITREAAMAGVWVVASNKGALAEDIRSGVDGDIFSPEKIDELVSILQGIDRDPEKYHHQLPAPQHIRTVDEQVSELVGYYESILMEEYI